jgi:hypothetical protein
LPAVAELTVRVEVPEPPTIEPELSVAARPSDGLAVSNTVPVNPLTGDTVIVTVAESPALMVTLVVLAVIWKSWTATFTVVERDSEPLMAVTVTT